MHAEDVSLVQTHTGETETAAGTAAANRSGRRAPFPAPSFLRVQARDFTDTIEGPPAGRVRRVRVHYAWPY